MEIDFKLLFESAPRLCLVLNPELQILAVSDTYLIATMTVREEIVGKNIFDVFPGNPYDNFHSADKVQASFQKVLSSKKQKRMPLLKYDIHNKDGNLEERWWNALNAPVLIDGEVTYIIHMVEDATAFVKIQETASKVNENLLLLTDLTKALTDHVEAMG